MIITCEQCHVSFNLNENLLKPTGSKVRCSKCNNIFLAYPPPAEAEPVKPTEVVPDLKIEHKDETAFDQPDLPDTAEIPEEVSETEGLTEEVPEPQEVADETVAIEDLDLDLDLESEEVPEPQEVADETVAIEDLDLDLDLESEEAVEPQEVADETVAIEDLDLDLDLEPEEAAEPQEVADETVAIEDLDLDLDFEPEEAAEPQEVADETVAIEDLDLDLDFESEEAAEPQEVADEAIEDLQLDFDLEADAEKMPETEEPSDEALDELELALDMDTEPESASVEAEESDELDLSDIEAMLDSDTAPEAKDAVEPEEVELEFDLETEPAMATDTEDVAGAGLEEGDAADLSELEQMLDVKETLETEDDATLEDFDLDLEMDEAAIEEDASEAEVVEFGEAAEPSEKEDFELEYEDEAADELEVPAEKDADDFYVKTHVMEPGAMLAAAGVADKEEKEEEKRPVPARKKRISMPVMIGLIVILLAGAAFGAIALLNNRNIRIPFISDVLFKSKVEDPGNLMITPLGVNGKFVENTQAGHLLVITGQVKNDYSHNRSFIKITGKILSKNNVAVKTETVFCGNFLSDNELANLDLGAIKTRLMNRMGDKKSNFSVKPGQMIPFMIVLYNLPDNLEEFSIEVAESTQG